MEEWQFDTHDGKTLDFQIIFWDKINQLYLFIGDMTTIICAFWKKPTYTKIIRISNFAHFSAFTAYSAVAKRYGFDANLLNSIFVYQNKGSEILSNKTIKLVKCSQNIFCNVSPYLCKLSFTEKWQDIQIISETIRFQWCRILGIKEMFFNLVPGVKFTLIM